MQDTLKISVYLINICISSMKLTCVSCTVYNIVCKSGSLVMYSNSTPYIHIIIIMPFTGLVIKDVFFCKQCLESQQSKIVKQVGARI